jgi:hypothetical protein
MHYHIGYVKPCDVVCRGKRSLTIAKMLLADSCNEVNIIQDTGHITEDEGNHSHISEPNQKEHTSTKIQHA